MCVYTRTHRHARTHAHRQTDTDTHAHSHTCMHAYRQTDRHRHTCTQTRMHARIQTDTDTHVPRQACMHAYRQTDTDTHAHRQACMHAYRQTDRHIQYLYSSTLHYTLTGYSPKLLHPPPHRTLWLKWHQQWVVIKHHLNSITLLCLRNILDAHNCIIQWLHHPIQQRQLGIFWEMLQTCIYRESWRS